MVAGRAVGVCAAIVVMAGAFAVLRARRTPAERAAPTVARSLVVLPFDTDAPQNDLPSVGIADEIATALSSVPGLRIVSAVSSLAYRPTPGARQLGALLNAGAVLHGTLQRNGKEVRANLVVTSTANSETLGSAELVGDTADLRKLENDIASSVSGMLRAELGLPAMRVMVTTTQNPLAHKQVLRALSLQDRHTRVALDSAIALLEHTVRLDTSYARAWSALATMRAMIIDAEAPDAGLARARVAALAQRAIALDSMLSEPHVLLGHVHAARGDAIAAEREFLKAIRLDPRLARARHEYSQLLSRQGRLGEALREARRAHELDPLAPDIHRNYVLMLERAGYESDARDEMADLRRITKYLGAHR